jgi:hypothetical protein
MYKQTENFPSVLYEYETCSLILKEEEVWEQNSEDIIWAY